MNLGKVFLIIILLGFSFMGGKIYEKNRVKSFKEISQMLEHTAEYGSKYDRRKVENLQSYVAEQILKKYLPEETQKQEEQKTEGGEK